MKVKIDGTDRAAKIRPDIEVENVLTKQVDSARFFIEDAGALGLTELQEVIISNDAETVRYFAGFIDHLTEYARGTYLDYDVECTDYTFLLEHPEALVNGEYVSQNDDVIIADFMASSCPDIEVATYVKSLRTLERVRFPRMTPREVLEVLAEMSGGDWYVDYGPTGGAEKAYLRYFDAETYSAPFELSDSPDMAASYPYEELVQETWAPAVNMVEVVGGDYLSGDQLLYLAGDGEATEILSPYRLRAPVAGSLAVWRNDGSDAVPSWTALTVGVGYINDITDYDCLLYYQEKYIEFATAPPDLKLAVKVSGRQEIPVRVRVRDNPSYAEYGRWLATVIVDREIVSKDGARKRAKAVLAQEAMALPRFRLRTRQAGFEAGQKVRLVNSARGLDDYYLIQRVVTHFEGGGYANYDVELGTYNPDLVDLIIGLKRQTRAEWSEDEVLDELLDVSVSVPVTIVVTTTIHATGDYYWDGGADDDGDTVDTNWDFATWG